MIEANIITVYFMTKKTTFKSPVTGKEYVGNLEPRYSGIPTFMRTPHAKSLKDIDIGLIGVPYDGGSPTVLEQGMDPGRFAISPA